MTTAQFSLMTFGLTKELVRKTMTVQDTYRMAADSGIQKVDLRWVSGKQISEYRDAIKATGVTVCCYISAISFFAKEKAICKALEREMAIAASLDAELFMIVLSDDTNDLALTVAKFSRDLLKGNGAVIGLNINQNFCKFFFYRILLNGETYTI